MPLSCSRQERVERRACDAVDRRHGNGHATHPPIRNKIKLADPAQVRAWTRRLKLSADELKTIVDKVGDSVAAVTK
jgi:hypothetical protein